MEQVQITAFTLFGVSVILCMVVAYLFKEILRLRDIAEIRRKDKLYYMEEERKLRVEKEDLVSRLISLQSMVGANDK